jgi:hypothetical protein
MTPALMLCPGCRGHFSKTLKDDDMSAVSPVPHEVRLTLAEWCSPDLLHILEVVVQSALVTLITPATCHCLCTLQNSILLVNHAMFSDTSESVPMCLFLSFLLSSPTRRLKKHIATCLTEGMGAERAGVNIEMSVDVWCWVNSSASWIWSITLH